LNESLIFLVIFPTPFADVYTLYKLFTLPIKSVGDVWSILNFQDLTRLIKFKNVTTVMSISGWTNENQLVIFESDYLKQNTTTLSTSCTAPANNHMRLNTLYGVWTVCDASATLHKWSTTYVCENFNYSVPASLPNLDLVESFDVKRLASQKNYKQK